MFRLNDALGKFSQSEFLVNLILMIVIKVLVKVPWLDMGSSTIQSDSFSLRRYRNGNLHNGRLSGGEAAFSYNPPIILDHMCLNKM
jgi:hypothetical protein